MSTKAGTIGVSTRPVWFPLWTAVVSGLAVAALIMSAVALGTAVRGDDRAALPAPVRAVASGSAITGTGPGLIQLAHEASMSAALRRTYSGSSITGTGPALVHVAFDQSLPQVTGTGPGLVQVAEQSSGER